MATYSNYALRIPSSLMDDLRMASMHDKGSMNGFIVQAVAEKVAALRARGILPEMSAAEQAAYLEARAARSREGRFTEILRDAGTTTEVLPGDEVPEGWLDGTLDDPGAEGDRSGPQPRMGR